MGIMYSLVHVLLLLAALAMLAAALDSSLNVSAYSDCAAKCFRIALEGDLCDSTDQTCQCTDQQFQTNATSCVTPKCSITEGFEAKNLTLTDCGVPVRDRSKRHIALSQAMTTVAAIFVMIRLGYDITVRCIHQDGCIVLATMVSYIASTVVSVYGTAANGLGRDIWTLTSKQITVALRFFYVSGALCYLQSGLIKLAIISFYLRIFPARNIQLTLWTTFVLTALWNCIMHRSTRLRIAFSHPYCVLNCTSITGDTATEHVRVLVT